MRIRDAGSDVIFRTAFFRARAAAGRAHSDRGSVRCCPCAWMRTLLREKAVFCHPAVIGAHRDEPVLERGLDVILAHRECHAPDIRAISYDQVDEDVKRIPVFIVRDLLEGSALILLERDVEDTRDQSAGRTPWPVRRSLMKSALALARVAASFSRPISLSRGPLREPMPGDPNPKDLRSCPWILICRDIEALRALVFEKAGARRACVLVCRDGRRRLPKESWYCCTVKRLALFLLLGGCAFNAQGLPASDQAPADRHLVEAGDALSPEQGRPADSPGWPRDGKTRPRRARRKAGARRGQA